MAAVILALSSLANTDIIDGRGEHECTRPNPQAAIRQRDESRRRFPPRVDEMGPGQAAGTDLFYLYGVN